MNLALTPKNPSTPVPEKATPTAELVPITDQTPAVVEEDVAPGPANRAIWRLLGVVAFLGALVMVAVPAYRWYVDRPFPVHIAYPITRTVTETIAVTGRVIGQRETAVGAQTTGIITDVWVRAGDKVVPQQVVAQIENTVAAAQLAQAQEVLATAKARLAEAAAPPRPSELDAARARVWQAVAATQQAAAAKQQAETSLTQAQAAVTQAEARRDLVAKNRDRTQNLYQQGAIAAQQLDQANADVTAAEADLRTAQERVKGAQAAILSAQASVTAAQQAARAADADLRTLQAGARPETLAVASRQVHEAEEAVGVARAQVRSSVVRAPYGGTVTEILAEAGTSVAPGVGILRIVQSGPLEVHMDVDEGNLPTLRVGQRVVVTSTAYRDKRLEAKVTRVGSQVDATRGTVEVVVTVANPPEWIRPGQTLNVNVVTDEAVRRVMIPTAALRSDGDRRYVMILRDGKAVRRNVLPGEVANGQVTILEGVKDGDTIIADPTLSFTDGTKVRVLPEDAKSAPAAEGR